jgi:hypothetical protein
MRPWLCFTFAHSLPQRLERSDQPMTMQLGSAITTGINVADILSGLSIEEPLAHMETSLSDKIGM